MKTRLTIFAAAVMVLAAASAHPAVLVVDPDGGGDFLEVWAAVSAAVDGDIIEFVDGIHDVTNENVSIMKYLVFRSESGDASSCILRSAGEFFSMLTWLSPSGDSGVQIHDLGFSDVFLFLACGYRIEGCRFHWNDPIGLDGGIWIDGGVGWIENCTFSSTMIHGLSHPLVVKSCQFIDSIMRAVPGPGEQGGGPVYLNDCSFSGSSCAVIGGGSVHVQMCTFSDNNSGYAARGGLLMTGGDGCMLVEVKSCMFSDNQLGAAPAFFSGSSVTMIEDCSFRNNSTSGLSAGLEMNSQVICDNVDFAGNSAPNGFPDALVNPGSVLHMNCCDIDENNIGGDGLVIITDEGCSVETRQVGLGDLKAMYR